MGMGFFFGRDNNGYESKGDHISAASAFSGDQEEVKEETSMDEIMKDESTGIVDTVDTVDTEQDDTCFDGSADGDRKEHDEHTGAGYFPVHFIETRKYLQQVRDQKRRIQLMEKRIQYRRDAGFDTSRHEEELEEYQEQLAHMIAEVAEEISKLGDVSQEVVMTYRYIDVMSWDEVSETADLKMRTVLKCHGHALPRMQDILLADGLIELEGEGYNGQTA